MLAEFAIKRIEARQIEPAMQRGQRGAGVAARERQMEAVDVEMDHVEIVGALENLLEHHHVQRDGLGRARVEPYRALAHRDELGARGCESPLANNVTCGPASPALR